MIHQYLCAGSSECARCHWLAALRPRASKCRTHRAQQNCDWRDGITSGSRPASANFEHGWRSPRPLRLLESGQISERSLLTKVNIGELIYARLQRTRETKIEFYLSANLRRAMQRKYFPHSRNEYGELFRPVAGKRSRGRRRFRFHETARASARERSSGIRPVHQEPCEQSGSALLQVLVEEHVDFLAQIRGMIKP